MWTGTLQEPIKNPSGIDFTLTYTITDGVETIEITEPHVPSKERCVTLVEDAMRFRNRAIEQAAAVAATDTSILVGPVEDVHAVVFPPPDPPDQDTLDKQAFQQKLADYRIAKNGEALGFVMAPDSAQVLSEIQTIWNNLTDIQQSIYKQFLGGSSF